MKAHHTDYYYSNQYNLSLGRCQNLLLYFLSDGFQPNPNETAAIFKLFGIEPVKWLLLAAKATSVLIWHICGGKWLVKLLSDSCKLIKLVRLFILTGIEPLSLFIIKIKLVSMVKFPIVDGIDPEIWLPLRESVDKAASTTTNFSYFNPLLSRVY